MKKIVPDPPYPIPYITIINDLAPEEAMAQANKLMETLADTVHAYVNCQPDDRLDVMMDSAEILSQLVLALIRHARTKGAPV
ncbi:hypothetical protein N5D48_02320 [Pseudomonas sp. GD03858]|uniref:hypothetical protein n=1 Tax=unclassified Pseudomonas TaxID=196821 RepID=UPI0024476578|nr:MULTISPECIES: hypothetical protein [unclassified Pseudomonas]MDH0645422.1 hypothetical protein [Pseudomonas sp. GD03867]MDH0661231.1 hypothetical protein [Pseudomonas sp. GD03858]